MLAQAESLRSKNRHSWFRRSFLWLASSIACGLISLPCQAQSVSVDAFACGADPSAHHRAQQVGRRRSVNSSSSVKKQLITIPPSSVGIPQLHGESNGFINYGNGDTFSSAGTGIAPIGVYAPGDDDGRPVAADVFSSFGQGIVGGPPGVYAPATPYAFVYNCSSATGVDTTFPFQLPVVRDVFNQFSEAPPADWWKDEKYAETYSEDPFSLGKPVDRYTDPKTAITHWSKEQMPLRVYFSLSVSRARDGKAKQIIKQCLDEWVQASDHQITYELTEDFKNADVYFWQHSTADNYWAQTLQDFHKGRVETAKVLILEKTLMYLSERRFKAVCLHQVGHALGLDDVMVNNSVMSQYCCDVNHPFSQISDFDKHYLQGVYTTKAAHLPVQSPALVTITSAAE
jgi:hypothetical protein